MGKHVSYAIDIQQRHPLCPAVSYPEWDRLTEKIGLDDAIALGFRVSRRDTVLRTGEKKSVPKHRISPKGLDWP
jgi:hypothetical protein